jgi:hypothetical protein
VFVGHLLDVIEIWHVASSPYPVGGRTPRRRPSYIGLSETRG